MSNEIIDNDYLDSMTNDEAMFLVLGQDGFIMLNKALNFAIGVNENIIFTELMSKYKYYKGKDELVNGLFYCTAPSLYSSTSLTEKQQLNAINKLCKFGLIEKIITGIPAKRYFKIIATTQQLLNLIKKGNKIQEDAIKKIKDKNEEKILNKKEKMKSMEENKANSSGRTSTYKRAELLILKASKGASIKLSTEVYKKLTEFQNTVPTKGRYWHKPKVGTGIDKMEVLAPTKGRRNNTIYKNINNTINKEEQSSPIPQLQNEVMDIKKVWSSALTIIKNDLTETPFKTWILSISFKDYKDNKLVLEVPNDFSKGIINSRYKDTIEKAFRAVTNSIPEIEINIKETA